MVKRGVRSKHRKYTKNNLPKSFKATTWWIFKQIHFAYAGRDTVSEE